MNEFEQYLQKNKQKFEPNQVDSQVWLKIENKMLKDSNRRIESYLKVASVAIVLLIGAYCLYAMNKKELPPNEEKILAEFDLTKYNFAQQVKHKKQALAKVSVPQNKIDDFQILLEQLEFMDEQFQDYRGYIEQNGYQEFIGNQILNFYKSKIELLDKIQSEIEKINYYESKEPSNSKRVGIQI